MTILKMPSLVLFFAFSSGPLIALGQEYPTKPIRVIVPFPSAGTVDIVARTLSQGLTAVLRQAVTVENRLGASGNIGTEVVAKAPADGYTLLVTGTPIAINATLFNKLPFDTLKDFSPIILAAATPLVLVVNASLPIHSVKELIALARTKPGALNYGSASNGTLQHLSMELLKHETGVDIVHVPFKGSPPSMLALMSGDVSVMISDMPTALPQVKAGKIRALATTASSRISSAAGTPTFAEEGFPTLDMKLWIGAFAPAHTPPDIISKLNTEMTKILAEPQVRQRLAVSSLEPLGSTPAEFQTYLKSELLRWAKVVREGNIRAD